MLPSVLATQLQVGLTDYIETTFPITNPVFKGSVRRMLETQNWLFREPYVAVHLPFRVSAEEKETFHAVRPSYRPYVHQQRAFDRLTGEDGRSTLIVTGTGSGKTECFLYPILEYCYAHRGESGIKALIIYPMNALAADQAKRIAELINGNPKLKNNVTAGMYVGGFEKDASRGMSRERIITDHETMLNSPPDILLTNYKMLDYLLVRPRDAALWHGNNPETLKYIVVDELHTFDGAQGTDLACLLRRLKARLWTPAGYLCCIGTSATMGSKDNPDKIRQYAEKVFGEPFEQDCVIIEDRLSASEFFAGHEVLDHTLPTSEQTRVLAAYAGEEDEEAYLTLAARSWLAEHFDKDRLFSDSGRVALAECLMGHSFTQSLLEVMAGNYAQPSYLIECLALHFPDLHEMEKAQAALDALLALISHARVYDAKGNIRPFLHVQVQIWMRELRRLLAKVSDEDITFALSDDLNEQQVKHYLPVVNCRDCGETGWASMIDERGNLNLPDLRVFYNLYFKTDKKIRMIFPHLPGDKNLHSHLRVVLCPHCLHVQPEEREGENCSACGKPTIPAWMPHLETSGARDNRQYECPFCGSKGGISLIGLRSATAISALISQLYASHFNDDKKLLAFSDNVQDAAHRAGFFNSRTWRFGLRSAIQRFAMNRGDNLSLSEFAPLFVNYWSEHMTKEAFVTTFIAPNMTWMKAYEQMQEKGKLVSSDGGKTLIENICRRLEYEVFLEFGLRSRIGRTLEKSGCCVLGVDEAMLEPAIQKIHERVRNEVGELRTVNRSVISTIIAGWLYKMKTNGAFYRKIYEGFIKEGAKSYLLSNDLHKWLPGVRPGRNTPRFIARNRVGKGRTEDFDIPYSRSWYGNWIRKNLISDLILIQGDSETGVADIIIDELLKSHIFVQCDGPRGTPVWALSPEAMHVSTRVVQMACERCGSMVSVAKENLHLWEDSNCMQNGCYGRLHIQRDEGLDYYGKLYSKGSLVRVLACEHTGLLERNDREGLETAFKSRDSERKPWDVNLLSCTPTLEMGIDIGDLSTVVLCSIPPSQSQYMQRVGRAGRKDGNSLTIAVANARPHDLYFYVEPTEMIAGMVEPPDVFLNASAVLERQFVAYCMDCWVKSGIREQAIPRNIGSCLSRLKTKPGDLFPYNFLNYVQNNLTRLHRTFIQLFVDELSEESITELRRFAQGDGLRESPMHIRIHQAFESLYGQREALQKSIQKLRRMIRDLEKKPRDSSFDKDLQDLYNERNALVNVVRSINSKDIFNFFSDEGLLPNYAFPEAGIVLKAVLYRKEGESEESSGRRRYERLVYEYNRSASSAISEFAPTSTFYAGGRKLSVDQVDLVTAQSEKWRLCPNCPHAQLEETGKDVAYCPRCGSMAWADSGQVRSMLKVQMVYSTMDYTKSLIGDESDDRSTTFYCKEMLVDVDEDHDIISAYRMENDEFPFGYEFVQKATMREINFGERDIMGEKLSVAGREDVRKGFIICRYCGKIQLANSSANHTMTCRAKNQLIAEPFEECMFLYREFTTEAIRLLIPATTMESSNVRRESFVAAFMLGMKSHFGNVDHLRVCVSEVPVSGSEYHKQYLVVYDSVPGGTGYLKQLMRSKTMLAEVFEKALTVLEDCSCQEDSQKDGCYRCLYAYRQSRHIGDISRKEAIKMLRQILKGKDNIESIPNLGSIQVNHLFESELERLFIEALARMGNEQRAVEIHKQLVNNKEGYHLQVGECLWEVELQVNMDETSGITEPSRADFVLRPKRSTQKQRLVAIFTDGFVYHKDRVSIDTMQRTAILQTGEYRVWTLSWKDVQQVFQAQGEYSTQTLLPEQMPSGRTMYRPTVQNGLAERLQPDKMGAFELLIQYLSNPDAEDLFTIHANAYALSLLEPKKVNSQESFSEWLEAAAPILEALPLRDEAFSFGDTMFGHWNPSQAHGHLNVLAGVSVRQLREHKTDAVTTVICLLNDGPQNRTEKYESNWNGFWHFANMMQFLPSFAAVTECGLNNAIYDSLSTVEHSILLQADEAVDEAWKETLDTLFDDAAKICAREMVAAGWPAPSTVGYELAGENNEVIGEAEMVWEKDRIAWLLPAQLDSRGAFEARGWKVYTSEEPLRGVKFNRGEHADD